MSMRPNIWWSPELGGFIAEHCSESGNYEVIQRADDGWFVNEEQEIELPVDAVLLLPRDR